MKTLRLLLVMMLCLSGISWVMAQDAAEAQFIVLESGVPASVDVSLEDGYSGVLLKFSATEGDVINLSVEAEFDSYLVLYGPAGTIETFNDDRSANNLNAQIEAFELTTSGEYYALVTTPIAFVGALDAEVDISDFDDDEIYVDAFAILLEGSTPADSEEVLVEIASGATETIDITEASPIGYVTFTAEAGDVISISAESDDVDTILYLFDPAGNQIGFNDDIDVDDFNSKIEFEAPLTGQYLAFATVYDYVEVLADLMDATGSIEITVE